MKCSRVEPMDFDIFTRFYCLSMFCGRENIILDSMWCLKLIFYTY